MVRHTDFFMTSQPRDGNIIKAQSREKAFNTRVVGLLWRLNKKFCSIVERSLDTFSLADL